MVRSLFIVAAVLLVPIVPFLLLGDRLDVWVDPWVTSPPTWPVTAAVVAGLLATDIVLPVPSSAVITLAGHQLGTTVGTAVSWVGMSLGAIFAFALARAFGRPLARRFVSDDELDRMERLSGRYGPLLLVLTRALPVLAEASVLLLGVHRLEWRRFLPAVLATNFGIALGYAAFGEYAARQQWLPAALGISIAAPVAGAWLVRRRLVPDDSV
jgi:uncharacterized membrane protein YdjX (TVP38/TMEM64 family)